MAFRLDWRGDEVAERLDESGRRAGARVILDAINLAKVYSPVATGTYQRSHTAREASYRGDDTAAARAQDLAPRSVEEVLALMRRGPVRVGSFVDYAYAIERGTETMNARPVVQTAVMQAAGRWPQYAQEEAARLAGA